MKYMITSRQSKKARDLLKWNIHDVIQQCPLMSPDRLEKFERTSIRLTRPENEKLRDAYTKAGVTFTADYDVILIKKLPEEEGADLNERQKVEIEDISEVEAVSEHHAKQQDDDKENEKNKLWVHTPEYTGPDRRNLGNQIHYSGDEKRKNRQDMVARALAKHKKS